MTKLLLIFFALTAVAYTQTSVNGIPNQTVVGVSATPGGSSGQYQKNVSGSFSGVSTIPSSDLTFTQTGTGAVSRTLDAKNKEFVSVKDFGAVGNGSTDDTAAVQAALNASHNIYFPSGTYLISTTLTPLRGSRIYSDPGIDENSSESALITTSSSIPIFTISDNGSTTGSFVSIENLGLTCGGTAGSVGVKIGNSSAGVFTAGVRIKDVRTEYCGYGFEVLNAFQVSFSGVISKLNLSDGIYVHPPDYTTTFSVRDNSEIAGNGGYGIRFVGKHYNLSLTNSAIESNATGEVLLSSTTQQVSISDMYFEAPATHPNPAINLGGAINATIRNSIFENYTYGVSTSSPSVALTIDGNKFTGYGSATSFVSLSGGATTSVSLRGNWSDTVSSFGTSKYVLCNNHLPDSASNADGCYSSGAMSVEGGLSLGVNTASDYTVSLYGDKGLILDNGQTGQPRIAADGADIFVENTNASGDIYVSKKFGLASSGKFIVKMAGIRNDGNSWSADNNGTITATLLKSASNCSSSASPAVCGASFSGSVTVAAAATTKVVNTSAVTASSQILLTFDSSLGTKLGVTCNTTAAQPTVSARTAGTSFTITVPSAPTTNPACFSYSIVN